MLQSFELYLRSTGKTEDTVQTYVRTITRFQKEKYGTEDPREFPGNYQKWINEKRQSLASQNVRKAAGQMYYRFLTGEEKKINFLPSERIENSAQTPWLTRDEFGDLLVFMKNTSGRVDLYRRNVTIMETFVYTGFKVSQVADLQVGDVDLRGNFIRSGEQKIPLAKPLRESLKLWIEHRRDLKRMDIDARKKSPLFLSKTGKKMSRRTISQMIESYYLPGMKITPEILRHTFAKWLLQATDNDTEFVRSLLGVNQSKYLLPESKFNLKDLRELPMR